MLEIRPSPNNGRGRYFSLMTLEVPPSRYALKGLDHPETRRYPSSVSTPPHPVGIETSGRWESGRRAPHAIDRYIELSRSSFIRQRHDVPFRNFPFGHHYDSRDSCTRWLWLLPVPRVRGALPMARTDKELPNAGGLFFLGGWGDLNVLKLEANLDGSCSGGRNSKAELDMFVD